MIKISMRSSIFLITAVEKKVKQHRNNSNNKWNNSNQNQMICIRIYHHWYLLRIMHLGLYLLVLHLLRRLLQHLIILRTILIIQILWTLLLLIIISPSTLTIWFKTAPLVVWIVAQLRIITWFTYKALNLVRNPIILRKRSFPITSMKIRVVYLLHRLDWVDLCLKILHKTEKQAKDSAMMEAAPVEVVFLSFCLT